MIVSCRVIIWSYQSVLLSVTVVGWVKAPRNMGYRLTIRFICSVCSRGLTHEYDTWVPGAFLSCVIRVGLLGCFVYLRLCSVGRKLPDYMGRQKTILSIVPALVAAA